MALNGEMAIFALFLPNSVILEKELA